MFTDIVGYTALTQSNEPLAMKLLEKHRELIRPIFPKHSGHEVKTIGDAFLVEFDSALEATESAIEMQKILHEFNETATDKLLIRVGIHIGDVIHRGGDVYGDSVNIASRIEPLASGGGICISEQVYAQVRNKIPYKLTKMQPKELKNVAFPIDLYQIELPWERGIKSELEYDKHRLAVLPLTNMSADPADEYFADGMTEELISAMSGISGLTVIARTSVMQYKTSTKRASEIGRELDVGTLIEGSVRKAANRVRIAVQLIDARTEGHVWAQNYDKQLDDVFAIQSEIANRVAETLRIKLVDVERERLEKSPTENVEAHTLYLKGRYHWNKRSKAHLERALEYLQLAIESDPGYALAHVGVADCYEMMGDHGYMEPAEAYARAKEPAERAIRLDNSLSEAHLTLAWTLLHEWKWDQAEREFEQSIDLNPNNATAHRWYGHFLFFLGRNQEAMTEIERSLGLDPKSPLPSLNIAEGLWILKEYDGAIEKYKTTIAIESDFVPTLLSYLYALAEHEMFNEALEVHRKLEELHFPTARNQLLLSYLYARMGKRVEARSILEGTAGQTSSEYIPFEEFAAVRTALGDVEGAFKLLERAVDTHSDGILSLKYSPRFDSLRSDPRFDSLLRKMGLELKPRSKRSTHQ